jgi:hypothetical protein
MTPVIQESSSRTPGRRRRILQNDRPLRPSPGMAVAVVALFVALGGTAVARDAGSTKVLGARVVTVVRVSELVQPGSSRGTVALCPRGYQATGGGARHVHDYARPDDWDVFEVGPVLSANYEDYFTQPGLRQAPGGWGAIMRNVGPAEGRYAVAVVCAKVVVDQR